MTDPAVQAVADALRQPHGEHHTQYIDPDPSQRPRALAMAQVAVDAYRRHVLDSHPDAERWQNTAAWLRDPLSTRTFDAAADRVEALLAALADETAARQAAEADRDRRAVDRVTQPDRTGGGVDA